MKTCTIIHYTITYDDGTNGESRVGSNKRLMCWEWVQESRSVDLDGKTGALNGFGKRTLHFPGKCRRARKRTPATPTSAFCSNDAAKKRGEVANTVS